MIDSHSGQIRLNRILVTMILNIHKHGYVWLENKLYLVFIGNCITEIMQEPKVKCLSQLSTWRLPLNRPAAEAAVVHHHFASSYASKSTQNQFNFLNFFKANAVKGKHSDAIKPLDCLLPRYNTTLVRYKLSTNAGHPF